MGEHKTDKEPAWVRDPQAVPPMQLVIDSSTTDVNEVLTKLCAGHVFHCEFCGVQFPLWPICELATHMLDTHSAEMTKQMVAGFSLMAVAEITPAVQQWFNMQLTSRVGLRRRAREMGIATSVPVTSAPSPRRIILPV